MRSLLRGRRGECTDRARPATAPVAIPTHPEAVPGDEAALRWIVPAGVLTRPGRVVDAPGTPGTLLRDPAVIEAAVEPGGSLLIRFRSRADLVRLGPPLRTALPRALAAAAAWTITALAASPERDALIRAAADAVLAGSLGDYIRSHGGEFIVTGVRDGVVEVTFRGMCSGCPISPLTLHLRFERELRERCPELVAVCAA